VLILDTRRGSRLSFTLKSLVVYVNRRDGYSTTCSLESAWENRVRKVILVVKVERQRELEVTALHCQECGLLEISAPPDAIPMELSEPTQDRGRPN